ncbi:MAG TPA: methyltransferase domain-containing protein [Dehalococcoidia bacterium]|nr:methyltransferase domain-containing protein [Dehalococcoidia bacterium]
MTATRADPYAPLAHYYDLEISAFEDDISMYLDLARESPGPVLELGIGTGRVGLALAEHGYDVTGIDTSEAMLAIAQERAASARRSIELLLADMRDFDLERRFGLVVCALGSFRHLLTEEDRLQTLQRVREHLEPAGRFVLHVPAWHTMSWEPNPPPVLFDWSRTNPETDNVVTKFNVVRPNGAEQLQVLTLMYDEQDSLGSIRRLTVEMPLYTPTRSELALLFGQAGLRALDWHGGFDFGPYDALSPELIAIAAREEAR